MPHAPTAWARLVHERLQVVFSKPLHRWHRAQGWWSLQLDDVEPFFLYICDNGQLHVNWSGTRDGILSTYPALIKKARVATPLATPPIAPYRWILEMCAGADHPDASRFVDAILRRAEGFSPTSVRLEPQAPVEAR